MRFLVGLFFAFSSANYAVADIPAITGQLVDDLPDFSYDDAFSCLAYRAAHYEADKSEDVSQKVKELLFWSQLLLSKGSPEDVDTFYARFDGEFVKYSELTAIFEVRPENDEDWDESTKEAAEILTGMGKMCWFKALTVSRFSPLMDQ